MKNGFVIYILPVIDVDNFGIFSTLLGVNCGNFGILALFQALIADNLGIF